jgi:hypothetical protein
MGIVYDGLLVEVRIDCNRRKIVTESEIRIYKEMELYEERTEVCVFRRSVDVTL